MTKLQELRGKLKILNKYITEEETGSVRHCRLVSIRNDVLESISNERKRLADQG